MLFFPSAWAQYETAKPGTLRLVPAEERVRALRSDYVKMQPMFFTRPPSFEDVIERLRQLEGLINDRARDDEEGHPQVVEAKWVKLEPDLLTFEFVTFLIALRRISFELYRPRFACSGEGQHGGMAFQGTHPSFAGAAEELANLC